MSGQLNRIQQAHLGTSSARDANVTDFSCTDFFFLINTSHNIKHAVISVCVWAVNATFMWTNLSFNPAKGGEFCLYFGWLSHFRRTVTGMIGFHPSGACLIGLLAGCYKS